MVEHSVILQDQTAQADGTVFSGPNSQNGTGVAVIIATPKGIRFRAQARSPRLRQGCGLISLFLLSRSCYARRPSVVVLLDRTVGTVTVPKQT